MNLLRSGRTQARALSSPGPARGAARPQGLADKRGAMKENTAPGSAGAVRVGDRGVPGSGGFCELNLAGSERTLPGGPAWVQGNVLETAEHRGGAESRKFATRTAPPGWSSHLWASLELGLWLWSRDPHPHRGGRPPSPRGWRDAANQQEGTPAPSPPFLAGWRPPHKQRQVLPVHCAAPAVKARDCSRVCLAREAAESPDDCKEGDRQENWRGTAGLLLPRIDCHSSLRKSSGKTLW